MVQFSDFGASDSLICSKMDSFPDVRLEAGRFRSGGMKSQARYIRAETVNAHSQIATIVVSLSNINAWVISLSSKWEPVTVHY